MHPPLSTLALLLSHLPSTFPSSLPPQRYCKPHPSDSHWPTQSQWSNFNTSLSGHLTAPIPLGAPCHPSRPEYNNATCSHIASQWSNTTFQSQNPVSADYNDDTCLPNPEFPCSSSGYPNYVVEAENLQDIQTTINFVRETGIRLVIKGTGHDFPGRSSGSDSLGLWTHKLKGLEVKHGDPRATKLGGIASLKIYAGEQMRSIYAIAKKENLTIVGGSNQNVGIGGWIGGGGHSPLSARFGMGADQVLEMEVVTADGKFRTINAECDPELFWAMRGGGAGTFAVLVSVTVKAYEVLPASLYEFGYATMSDSEAYWNLVAYFHAKLPELAEKGVMGYYFVTPLDSTQKNASINGVVYGTWIAPTLTEDQVRSILGPVEDEIKKAQWGDPVHVTSSQKHTDNFIAYWPTATADEAAGFPGARLGSRLLSNESLLGDFDKLKNALRTSTPAPWSLLGHLVALAPNGPQVVKGIAGGTDAVLPAWRKSYVHAVLSRSWLPLNRTSLTNVTTDLRDVAVAALRDIEPETGAYMSESDPTEPDWQRTKFGDNYGHLLRIKQQYDPKGLFWCKQCVGSELWSAEGEFGIENGVGQNKVRLCRERKGRGPRLDGHDGWGHPDQ